MNIEIHNEGLSPPIHHDNYDSKHDSKLYQLGSSEVQR